jgi:hypothetical protein
MFLSMLVKMELAKGFNYDFDMEYDIKVESDLMNLRMRSNIIFK